jgi:hypothetical protein
MRRRRFVKLMAASAAAVLASSLDRAVAAPKNGTAAKTPSPAKPMTPAIRAEIAAQKKSLEDTLKVIRQYQLPPGSPPAFVFRAERREVRRGR